ncbi:PadR family transcriptional regulator [Salicibibacter cibi]|nr:PadR family transcriptional regulator [Salicibibacter cibi]
MNSLNTELLKGIFELVVLFLISKKPMYGYEITTYLQENHTFTLANGSIYPILQRLIKKGWASSFEEYHKGRIRKYYETTKEGRTIALSNFKRLENVYDFLRLLKE